MRHANANAKYSPGSACDPRAGDCDWHLVLTACADKPHPARIKISKNTNKSAVISSSRWLAYATAGAATALGSVTPVEAEIHYSGILDVEFNGTFNTSRSFPLKGGVKLAFQRSTSFHFIFWEKVELRDVAVSGAVRIAYSDRAEKLSFGQKVSSGRFSSYHGSGNALMAHGYRNSAPDGEFKDPGQGFVGFKFDVGNGVQYGWARIHMSKKEDHSFKLKDYAFGDPGDTVTAGQTSSAPEQANATPDSGSLGLLAVGGAGLVAWRKSRSRAAR
jgi:hypothetical protein